MWIENFSDTSIIIWTKLFLSIENPLRDTFLTHSETGNLKHKNCEKRGFIKQENVCRVIELCGAVKRGYSGCDRRLPCAAPTATMYPDTPTFYIDSNIDPGLSQPSSSYRSFYLYEICWGHEKSSEDSAFSLATPSWQDESTSEGSEGKPLLRPKGLRGPPLAAPASP